MRSGQPCFALSITISPICISESAGAGGTDGVSITVTLPAELEHTIQSHCCIIYEGQTLVGMGGVTVGPITWWFIFNEVNRPSRSSGAWHMTTEGDSCPSGVWLLLALMSITVIEFLQDL